MTKSSVHSFQGGMLKDLDKSLVTKERYLDAHNFRLLTSTGESTGALENVEGNNNVTPTVAASAPLVVGDVYLVVAGTATYRTTPYVTGTTFTVITDTTGFTGVGALAINTNLLMPANMYVVGSTFLRDSIVLFLTNNTGAVPTTGRSMIVKITVTDSTETIASWEVLYDDSKNNSTGYLLFSSANPIRAVATYETPTIQKVYWCDGFNNVKYINIVAYSTTNKTAYNGSTNYYFSPDLFEFIPEVTLVKPTLNKLYPGAITAGMVQYAFQYFSIHGAETHMSPLSNTIHITTDDDYAVGSYRYMGEGDLTALTGKAVRMDFSVTADSDKFDNIRIVRLHYKTVNSIPTITIVGEVKIHSTTATSVSFLDTGNNSLGVLTLDEFNLGETELFSAKDLAIKSNRLFAANIEKEEFSIGSWDARAVRFKFGSTATVTDSSLASFVCLANLTNWTSYDTEHDGVNGFNDPTNDGDAAYQWKYQADGATLGAEGKNIKIGFTTDAVVIDANSSQHLFSAATESTADNKSFTSFASPYMAGRRSWQRDETYRLYLVFFNAHGVASNPKWVCDLRMPSLHDTNYSTLGIISGTNLVTTALYPTVYLKSFPTGAVSAQLLRMERGGDDRSVLTQALVVPMATVSAAVRPQTIGNAVTNTAATVKLVSPEINILKNVSKGSSDYLEYVTKFAVQTTNVGTWQTYRRGSANTQVAYTNSNDKAIIDDTLYVEPRSNTDTFSFSGATCANYDSAKAAFGCSGLLVHHTNPTWSASGNNYVIANYKRDVHASQYGGQTYESRENNIAIPCSDVIATATTEYTCWNGDTFICFFDVTTELSDLTKLYDATWNENVYMPLESSVNCDLRHDRSASKAVLDLQNTLMQEIEGKWTNASGQTYFQTTSLYQYNTVYSQDSTAKYYVNIPSTVSTDTDFDCMIKVSKTKINGEAQDSFTLFPVNDFLEVKADKGEITTLLTVNDKLLFWQENAFGTLSVNERSLIQDAGGASLVLGTGGVLDRFDYISDSVGATDNQHVVETQTGAYWVNTKDRSMYRFTQNLQNVSKSKLVQSWFEEQLSATNLAYNIIRTIYDVRYNHVLTSFYNSSTATGCTLVFDETIDAYSGFYDYYTTLFIPHLSGFMSVKRSNSVDMLYYHNSQLKERCCFHSAYPAAAGADTDSSKFQDSTVKVVFNNEYGSTKVFDNLVYTSIATLDDKEIYNNTFSSIRCYNNYQNTDYCTLTYGTNLERDEREWKTFIPRNAVNKVYTTSNLDIFDVANISKSRTFKERIRDKYMITDFKYTNTANRRFIVPYITVLYRISPR